MDLSITAASLKKVQSVSLPKWARCMIRRSKRKMDASCPNLQGVAAVTDTHRMLSRNNVLVSVVVPVYNSEEYVAETIISALKQFPGTNELEVIAVNDGSTDGSLAVLHALAKDDPRLIVLTQENSGGPSSPRNHALSKARGEYVFFLDADDVFADGGLEDIVKAAETHNSDVVLARFGSINGRHVPSHMFRKTEPDADLIKSNAWDSLGPVKLFRRSLIERLNLRFAEDQWIGEDQVFTSSMYLNAQKVTVLADREFILIRNRDDGGNITSRRQSLNDKYLTASRLGRVIADNVEEGPRRDRLMRRIFTSTLPSAVGHLLPDATDVEVTEFMEKFRSEGIDLYSEGVRKFCSHVLQLKYFVLFNGTVSQLRTISRFTAATLANHYVVDSSGDIVVNLPRDLEEAIPASLLRLETPQFEAKMTGLAHQPRAVIYSGTVSVSGVNMVPTLDQISLVERKTGETIPVQWERMEPTPTKPVGELSFSFTLSRDDLTLRQKLHEGAWGVFLQAGIGRNSQAVRFGKRSGKIPNHRTSIPAEIGLPSLTAYFNHGYENLTLDIDSHVHKQEPFIELLFSQDATDGRAKKYVFRATNSKDFDFGMLKASHPGESFARITDQVFELEVGGRDDGAQEDAVYVRYGDITYEIGS